MEVNSTNKNINNQNIFPKYENPSCGKNYLLMGLIFQIGAFIALSISVYTSGVIPPYFSSINSGLVGSTIILYIALGILDIFGADGIFPCQLIRNSTGFHKKKAAPILEPLEKDGKIDLR
jgi:hypothetical protein